jgi:hypothetical protein
MKEILKNQLSLLFIQTQVYLENLYKNFFIYKTSNNAYLVLKSLWLIIFTIPFVFVITPIVGLLYLVMVIKALCDACYNFLFVISLALNIIVVVIGAAVSIIMHVFFVPDYIYASDRIFQTGK